MIGSRDGATVRPVLPLPDGSPALADLNVSGTLVAVAATFPGGTMATPATTGTTTGTTTAAYHLTVGDAVAALRRADAGANVFEPLQDAFWGVRTVQMLDPWGLRGAFDQHVRDVSDSEVERNLASLLSGGD